MDKLRREILSITKRKPEIGLVYYNELLDIIDDYHDSKPDTSVETCKAIIEGISKLIIHKIDGVQIHILDKKWGFEKLVTRAFTLISRNNSELNEGLVKQLLQVFKFINKDRNDHCDIGHGRASVKEQKNCSDYSRMIAGITESTAIYLLKKFNESVVAEDVYESEQMQDFNMWLDNSIENFPIKAERYSKLLYQTDKEQYYAIYNDDYLQGIIDESESDLELPKGFFDLSGLGINFRNQAEPEYSTNQDDHSNFEDFSFDEKEMFVISAFAKKNNLNEVELVDLLNEVRLRQVLPIGARCLQTINFTATLHERAKISSELKMKVDKLIKRLKIIEK